MIDFLTYYLKFILFLLALFVVFILPFKIVRYIIKFFSRFFK